MATVSHSVGTVYIRFRDGTEHVLGTVAATPEPSENEPEEPFPLVPRD